MNEETECMIELEEHKSENPKFPFGRISKVFANYLNDKYGVETAKRCLAVIT